MTKLYADSVHCCEECNGPAVCTCRDGWNQYCEFHGNAVRFVPADERANSGVLTHTWNGTFRR